MAKRKRSDRQQSGVVWIELLIALPIIALITLTVIDFSLKLSKTFQIQQMAEIVVSALRGTTNLSILPRCENIVQLFQDRIDYDFAPSIAHLADEIGGSEAVRIQIVPPDSYSGANSEAMTNEGRGQEPSPPNAQVAILKVKLESTEANCAVCWSQIFSNFRPSVEQEMYVSCQNDISMGGEI